MAREPPPVTPSFPPNEGQNLWATHWSSQLHPSLPCTRSVSVARYLRDEHKKWGFEIGKHSTHRPSHSHSSRGSSVQDQPPWTPRLTREGEGPKAGMVAENGCTDKELPPSFQFDHPSCRTSRDHAAGTHVHAILFPTRGTTGLVSLSPFPPLLSSGQTHASEAPLQDAAPPAC